MLDTFARQWAERTQFALESGHRPDTDTFRRQCRLAGLMGWALFLPRMAKAMDKANAENRQWSPWMHTQFETCTRDWLQALQDHP